MPASLVRQCSREKLGFLVGVPMAADQRRKKGGRNQLGFGLKREEKVLDIQLTPTLAWPVAWRQDRRAAEVAHVLQRERKFSNMTLPHDYSCIYVSI